MENPTQKEKWKVLMTQMQSNEINSKSCMKPKPRSNPKSKIGPIMGIRNKWGLIQLKLPNKADKPAQNKGQLDDDRIIGGKFLPPKQPILRSRSISCKLILKAEVCKRILPRRGVRKVFIQ